MSKAITFQHVSKQYVRTRRRAGDVRELLTGLFSRRKGREAFWALRDLSFDVEQGEAVGIIGHNGAGKSTALKVLARIVKPTAGHMQINGRVTPLIEVGAGFHPDLSGRENVYLNGSILGLSRRDVHARFESIVEFAELTEFIDTPVKRYSTGMQMRLGFAVAAHLNPDILLIDEVLAVGDMAFQRKCFEAIRELRRAGATLLFVSHSMEAVSALCDRVLLLEGGRLVDAGSPETIIAQYRRDVFEAKRPPGSAEALLQDQPVSITHVSIEDQQGEERRVFATGNDIYIRCQFRCHEPLPDAIFYAAIHRADGSLCFGTNSFVESDRLYAVEDTGSFRICFRDVALLPGSYLVTVRIEARNLYRSLASHDLAYGVVIDGSRPGWGTFYMPHAWHVDPDDALCRPAGLSQDLQSPTPSNPPVRLGTQGADKP